MFDRLWAAPTFARSFVLPVRTCRPAQRARHGVTAGRVDAGLAQAILYGAQKLPEPPIYVASKRASTRPRSRAAWGADLTVR